MGSRSIANLAYIAGFLDGDGSIMLQVKSRSDTKRGARFMATICFYQDTRHRTPLYWIQKQLGIGYIVRRNDGMTELRINGFATVGTILCRLQPYIRFKKRQTRAAICACDLLSKKRITLFSKRELQQLARFFFLIRKENYKSRSTLTRKEFDRIIGLTP